MKNPSLPLTSLLSRRDSLRSLALALGGAAFGSQVSAEEKKQPDPTAAPAQPIKAESLGDKLAMISGAGGNILAFGGEDGVVVVDSGLENAALGVTAEIIRAAGGPASLLVNTHWHFDHVGGNGSLAKGGARIIASLNCLARVSKDQVNEFFKKDMPALPPKARPVIAIQDETQLHLNGEVIRLVPVAPAHTDGDVLVHLEKANVLHLGDVFFHETYPFIDYSSNGWLGGVAAAVRTALEYTDEKTRIIPGHGALATQQNLKDYLAFLEAMYERLHNLHSDGHTLEEAVSTLPSKSYDEKLGKGFMTPEMFVRCTYEGILRHEKKAGS
ncbi:MBL fold metallo-hydrolase [Roseimicrobium sp. ORNL1]|uniref:MBL fold metallo-hydrolase n=1 Tax=Roseimicrobium sp. ORNL1 TaxID=2711231 RepID=UPI0013E19B31|nr:MBL fold metallo-hydrolase [Roseimicrobium sp. ORNL1]QIF00106.1 MBL fold metallo-hydrolase [Roseimicrobium sp. ORNL1]